MEPNESYNQREYIDTLLRSLTGVNKVYFQPPATVSLKYPCVIYTFSNYERWFADDKALFSWPEYEVTLIDRDPESEIHRQIMLLDQDSGNNCYVSFQRFYTADNLNHWSYRVTVTLNSI